MLSNLVRPTNLRFVFLSFVLALGPLTACGDDTEQPAGGGGSGAGGSGAGGGGEGGRAPLALTEVSLAPADGKRDDRFGADVAISGNTLLVGAPGKTTSKPDAGAAYVYVRDASGSWVEEAQLAAGTGLAYDQIGRAVDLDG
ncbi:MAG: FG-GAP repeat protein, partial [Myxococcales bacterium]|nr:FG-GAP repeat protein [Myxococcales bacterium]